MRDKTDLSRIDLNLLVVLDLLLKERHVSRVAEAMFVSQSAISRSLKKLRETFDDPLFTRTAKGLIPTPKALELEKELNQIMPALRHVFSNQDFDLTKCDTSFSIAAPAFLGSILVPRLYQTLMQQAPRAGLIEIPSRVNPFQLLDSGQLDFALHFEVSTQLKYQSTFLGYLYPVLYVRNDHPLVMMTEPELVDILEFPLIGMIVEDDKQLSNRLPITQIYQDLALQSRIPQLRSTQTQTLLNVLRATDSVLFGSNGMDFIDGFTDEFTQIYQLKQASKYQVPVYMVQHVRNETSKAHQWFAGLLAGEVTRLLGGDE